MTNKKMGKLKQQQVNRNKYLANRKKQWAEKTKNQQT